MDWYFRVFNALPEDLCFVPNIHVEINTTTYNSSSGDLSPSLVSGAIYTNVPYVHTQAHPIQIHKSKSFHITVY